jgi:predicted AAA+ superfamily ATPase
MRRLLEDKLLKWKQSPRRKPLLIRGIRQSGKTWLLQEFGKKYYESTAYFNFEKNKALCTLFKKNLEPERLITELGTLNNRVITPEKTLIIFDEIQVCSEAITSLKYFGESAARYHIATAGSLLGIALSRPASYPVGKVDMMTLNPMNFREFLMANNEDMMVDYLAGKIIKSEPVSEIFTDKLKNYLKTYYITGGMPEAVDVWIKTKDVLEVETVQQSILDLYELDFAKYAPVSDIAKLSMIWNSIPSQLARENGKFVYGLLREGAGARAFEGAITWLKNAGMIYKVYKIEKPAIPLKAYENKSYFKLYVPDVGLLKKMSDLSAKSIIEEDMMYREFKGAMAENFCLQEIVSLTERVPFYWSSGNLAEIDFILQFNEKIIPIEVKAADNVKSKSLAVYRKKYDPPVSVKASLRNLNFAEGVLNCPLYLLWKLPEILNDLQI